jgi:CxxC motif-containing protein (DUF1111 family)
MKLPESKSATRNWKTWRIARRRTLALLTFVLCVAESVSVAQNQRGQNFNNSNNFNNNGVQDPGVQSGTRTNSAGVAPGGTLIPSDDTTGFLALWKDGVARFKTVKSVATGLGPRFNSDSCTSCHAQPANGGSGAAVNPQFIFAGSSVAPDDTTPFFITQNGPTREARFPFFLDSRGFPHFNRPNGGVEDLFTVSGQTDAGTCQLSQPNFQAAAAANNLIFRIPTPLFGVGLIENLDDSTLLQNQASNLNNFFGIAGTFNRNGNDGTISRFGWKAQNKSLEIFAGEASNVEMGISNQLFPQDRPLPEEEQMSIGLPGNCLNLTGTGYPEDVTSPLQTTSAAVLDDVTALGNFMRFNAAPPPGTVVLNGNPVPQSSISNGQAVFNAIGCANCHNPTPGTTQVSNFVPALSNQPVPAFSDIEIHHMGIGLADNVSQGSAGGDQFRTAPLWGLGQRIFLLHDGRTTNLITAIRAHASNGSEATNVVQNFFSLTPSQQQALLDFLRSL